MSTYMRLQDFFSAVAESWKKLKTSVCFRRLLRVRIEIDQLERDRDFIFFTTDFQTMNYYSTIHCKSNLFLKYD